MTDFLCNVPPNREQGARRAVSGPTFTTVVDASARGKPVKPDTALQGSVGGLGNPADTSAPAREEVALNPRGQ